MVRLAQRHDVRFIELTIGMRSNLNRVVQLRCYGDDALSLAINTQRVLREIRLPKDLPG